VAGLTRYYLAASLDGYIAEPDGGLVWLDAIDASESDYDDAIQRCRCLA